MEVDSDAENQNKSNESKKFVNNNDNNLSNEGQQGKPKRQMKTPFQLETLEKAYASETYPSESTRAELSEKLGLSDRQLQMWFCHRRLKDKKEKETPPKKKRKNVAVVMPESPVDELGAGPEHGSDYGSGSGSGSSPYLLELRNAVGSSRSLMDDVPMVRRSYESQQSIMELRVIACVEAQLGEPLREDGPILGMEFDSLPPDAFGAPIAASAEQQKRSGHPYEGKVYDRHDSKSNKVIPRALHEYQSLSEQPYFHGSPVDGSRARKSCAPANAPPSRVHGVQGHVSRVCVLSQQDKPGHIFSSPNGGEDSLPLRELTSNNRINAQSTSHTIFGTEDPYLLSGTQTFNNDTELHMESKCKSDEARIAREAETNEIRIRKELERQDIMRRKSEERMKKEMEKHERERRKEEERLMRERQREEERLLREQKREMERREKFLQREYMRAEKRRLKEEHRMEKQAAKRKVAIEKATARKMAKESMDLIEDEQLELMDLAASSKGLSSIIHLDLDTLQNLDSFRDSLCVFPPKSVELKRPFAVQPWSDSEKNIGNLLMVWRFFITFADVLGLWPFTLDEFVQALHDYDSRLLGEIHLALLKSIIKDIEGVARTPSSGLGMNQYCTANPEGGHPQIIEGAYAWGFDIRNWQRHLNPLTWPEIFRQLALSAGFGPKLKKKSSTWASIGDNRKGKDCHDIVSTIRSGSAAENAFAWMREKGLLLPRRSRHKLTPGTVKFAAFHVLSLEGSKGLTVLELAEKIQKSGLRDLTTSKTPEASISVALTRDTKLFERIAPSTYCVRPAFRKDPADAEAILAAARKKIRIFENGFLGGEDADDVERDEDSDCDVDEDPEVEDLAIPSIANKNIDQYDEANTCSVSGKDNVCNDVAVSVQNEVDKGFSSFPLNGSKDARCEGTTEIAVEGFGSSHVNQENVEIDESKSGESWIQGLAEGDYSHISVEERLNALVALIGVANEGNSIRVVLEDRLEAANALKKQMWAEAQFDKSRLKEENISRLDFTHAVGSKAETHLTSSAAVGSQSPLAVIVDNKNEASPSLAEDENPIFGSQVQNNLNYFPNERTLAIQDPSTGLDNLPTQQHGYASKRSHSQLKAYIAHMAEEMYVYRSLPLGQDRRRNRYWQFAASASGNDPCSGRIFVELHDGTWRLIDTAEAFDAVLSSLDARGTRESHLRIMLQKIETSFKEKVKKNLRGTDTVGQSRTSVKDEAVEMDPDPDFANSDSPRSAVCGLISDTLETSSSFRIELGRNDIEKKAALERYQDFQRWMWKECFNTISLCALKNEKTRCMQLLAICDVCLDSHLSEDAHCPFFHQIFGAVDKGSKFSEHAIQSDERWKLGLRDTCVSGSSLPLGIRLLKPLSAVIEAHVPPEALEALWTEVCRKTWGMKLSMSSSADEVLQILTILESGIKRSYLSQNFETTKELLGSSNTITPADPWSVPILPWIPKTTAAVALRLLELDASIMYVKPEKAELFEDKEVNENIIPSKFIPLNNKEVGLKELDQGGLVKEENYANLAGKRRNYRRGKGNRDHGWSRKYHRKTPGITADAGKRNVRENENLNHRQNQQGIRTHGRGRRTVRKRADRTSKNDTFRGQMAHMVIPNSSRVLHRNLEEEKWGVDKERLINMEDAENSNSAEADSDDNAQAVEYEQGNWEIGFNGTSNGWNRDMMEVSDEDEDASGDDPGIEEAADEDSEENIEMSETSDQNGIDDGMDSAASEYSD